MKDHIPIGHIPRAHFYQKIGTLYGYNLYMRRATTLLVKNRDVEPMTLEPMTLSIAVTSNNYHTFDNENDLSDAIAQVKKHCKMQKQNCYIHYHKIELCRT